MEAQFAYWFLRVRRRFRHHLQRRETFVYSLVITYLLTIAFTLASIAIQIDGTAAIRSNSFEFYKCTNLGLGLFLCAKLLETLVPTAITFSGTVLTLQTDSSTKQASVVGLFVVITLLAVSGVALSTAKTLAFLEVYLWIVGVLCLASVVFSWQAICDPASEVTNHKKEKNDGCMSFN